MNEESLSQALFEEASSSDGLTVLSWQAVNGKGYFTADVKIRLPSSQRMEPDLIVASTSTIWLIEVKELHSDALADEDKLALLRDSLREEQIALQVSLRTEIDVTSLDVRGAVAYARDDLTSTEACDPLVVHLNAEVLATTGLPLLAALTREPPLQG